MSEWVAEYAKSHTHPLNRLCHTIGIPVIALSILIAPLSFVIAAFWVIPLAMFAGGWVLQFVGHAFERKPPEFFKDWRFLLVGLRWWFAKLSGRA
jgi:uncharacterized membrane protein YGL010W